MDFDYYEESIPLSEISRALPNDVIERYEYHQAQEAIVETFNMISVRLVH